jgi:hypothetical protein
VPFLHCQQLECLPVIHIGEFRLDLLGPESFENKETSHYALLERAQRVRSTFNFFWSFDSVGLSRLQWHDTPPDTPQAVLSGSVHGISAG